MLKILGIDPGTAITGYAVLNETKREIVPMTFGCIETSKNRSVADRLEEIGGDLEALIAKFQPDEVAIEELFFFKNVKTVIGVAQARGVLVYVCKKMKVPIFEYTPLQVKQALTGYGRAEKKQVQEMVKNILELKTIPKPDDVTDALAVAICHWQSRKMMGAGKNL